MPLYILTSFYHSGTDGSTLARPATLAVLVVLNYHVQKDSESQSVESVTSSTVLKLTVIKFLLRKYGNNQM